MFFSAGAVAALLLAYALVRGRTWPIPWAIVLLGAAYTGSLFLPERGVDREVPLVTGGFLLLAELSYWAVELRTPLRPEPGMLARRATLLVAGAVGAVVVAAAVVAATAVPLGSGVLTDLLGVTAAVAALALVARLAAQSKA